MPLELRQLALELRRLAPEGERNGLEVERETVKVVRQAPRVVRLPEKTPHPSPLPQGERGPEACGGIGNLTRMGLGVRAEGQGTFETPSQD